MSTLAAWARAHAATVRVWPAPSWAATDEPAMPAAGPPPPIDRVVVEPEPVLSVTDGSARGPYAVAAVAWYAGAGMEAQLATVGEVGPARLWNAISGQLTRVFEQPEQSDQRSIAVTPPGTTRPLIAAGGRSGMVRIWDIQTGDLVDSVGERWVDTLAWLVPGDGRAVLGIGATVGHFVWDESASPKWTALWDQGSASGTVYVASGSDPAAHPLLAVGSSHSVSVWDPAGGAQTAALPAPPGSVWAVAWGQAAGRSLLAVADDSGVMTIYDTAGGAVLRTIATNHLGRIYGLGCGITRDGRLLLATGSDDDTARIWEPLSGVELAVIEHSADVNTVAFAPAGTVLAQHPGGPAGTETLYLATGSDDAYTRVYAVHVPAIPGRARSAPARRPAAAQARPGEPVRGRAEPVEVAEAIDGPIVLPRQNGWLWKTEWVVTDAGQAWLACCGAIGEVKVLEPLTGEVVAELAVGATADQLSWGRLPDGPLMLAVGNRLGQLYVWDSADWLAGPRVLSSEPRRIDGLDLMAFGDRMLAAVTVRTETGTTRPILWDALSADQLTELDPQAGNAYTAALATEDDGLLLAVGLNSGQVIIYRPLNEEILDTIAVNDGAVWAVDWARADDDRLLLAIASDRGTVQVWDRRAASVIATFNTGETPVLSGGWGVTPRGRLLLTVSAASSAQVWDPVSGRQLARIEHPSQVNTVSFAPPGARPGEPDRMYLAAGCQNGELLVHTLRVTEAPARAGGAAGRDWPPAPGVPRGRLEPLDGVRFTVPEEPERVLRGHGGSTIWALHPAVAPDGRMLLASASQDETARVWDPATGEQLARLNCRGPVESAAWTPLGDDRLALVVAAAGGSSACVWEMPGGQTRELSAVRGARYVSWVTLADGIPRVAAATFGIVELVDPDTGSHEIRLDLDDDSAHVESVAGLAAAGRSYVAVGYASGQIRIWEPESGDVPAALIGHDSPVASLAWAVAADGRLLLASGSRDGGARIWDALAGECLAILPSPMPLWDLSWAVLADGRLVLATAGQGCAVHLWDPVRAMVVAEIGGEDSPAAGVAIVSLPPGEQGELLAASASRGGIYVFRVGVKGAERPAGPTAGPPAGRVVPAPGRAELESLVSGAVRLGEWGVWGALGLLGDLIELLDPAGDIGKIADRLNDPGLADLAPDPVLVALRGLGWRGVRARLGLAGLVIAGLVPGPGFVPPAGTGPGERVAALLLAAGTPYGGGAPGAEELRRALEGVPPSATMLLDLVGEETVAADPGLPVRLIAAAGILPVLGRDVLAMVSRSLRRMDRGDSWLAPAPAGGGKLDLSPDPVDRDLVPVLTRRGRPDRVVPTHLALPERVRVPVQATGGLLYRHHADPPAVMPRPATVVLDVSPAVFGPVEVVLRLVAHLLTVMVWQAGGQVSLVTTARPRVVVPLERRADLVSVWTARSVDAPDLHAASGTAAELDQPVVVLTHHATALDQRLRAGPGLAVVTTYTPGAPVPAGPVAWPGGRPDPQAANYHRLPPHPAADDLITLMDALLDYLSDPETIA